MYGETIEAFRIVRYIVGVRRRGVSVKRGSTVYLSFLSYIGLPRTQQPQMSSCRGQNLQFQYIVSDLEGVPLSFISGMYRGMYHGLPYFLA